MSGGGAPAVPGSCPEEWAAVTTGRITEPEEVAALIARHRKGQP